MKKHSIRAIAIMGISVGMYALDVSPNELMLSTLFTVASIFLSIGLSLIITFNLVTIDNDTFYLKIKNNINVVRKTFLIYFFIMTIGYLAGIHFLKSKTIDTVLNVNFIQFHLNVSQFIISIVFSLLLFGVFCFIMNFMDLQKLKDDIDDRLRQKKIECDKKEHNQIIT